MRAEQSEPHSRRFYVFRDAVEDDLLQAELLLREEPAYLHERSGIGETAFHFLVVENALEPVQWLLAQGSDINTRNNFGSTPLMEAASLGYVEMCRWLVENGADVRVTNEEGDTAFTEAAQNDQVEILTLLLDQLEPGEDINRYINDFMANVIIKEGAAKDILFAKGLKRREE